MVGVDGTVDCRCGLVARDYIDELESSLQITADMANDLMAAYTVIERIHTRAKLGLIPAILELTTPTMQRLGKA